jgi:two-component system LytT family response regulator
MKPIRTVIVDDEPPARDKLRAFLERHPALTLVGEAEDGLAAVRILDQVRPDLVLLDVQMPELDGFEVLEGLELEPLPEVIFVTAFDHYAVRAFEAGALDYLLKPVAPDRFDLAIERAIARRAANQGPALADRLTLALEAVASLRPPIQRFLIREQERSRFVALSEVDWIEAAGNYLKLHARSGTHLIRGTMKEVEGRLDSTRFARIHRTTIVNLDRVRFLEPWSHGDQVVILESGERLTLSRRFRDRLPRTLGDSG